MDILEANLDAESAYRNTADYGDAPNDMEHVTKCMPVFVVHLHHADTLIQTSRKSSGLPGLWNQISLAFRRHKLIELTETSISETASFFCHEPLLS